MNFDLLKVKAVIVSALPRSAGEESDVVISIGLDCTNVPVESVAGALRCDVDEARRLFDENGDGYLPNLKYLVAKEGWKKKHDVKIGNTARVRLMSVTSIRITPRAQFMSDMHLIVTVDAPPAGYIEAIADKLQNSAWIDLRQIEAELPLDGGGAADEPAEEQDTLDLQQPKPRGRPRKKKD